MRRAGATPDRTDVSGMHVTANATGRCAACGVYRPYWRWETAVAVFLVSALPATYRTDTSINTGDLFGPAPQPHACRGRKSGVPMPSESTDREGRASPLGEAARFDFTSKLGFFPHKAANAVHLNPLGSLSVVYLDVNTNICNHACTFCDGFYRPLQTRSIPTHRLLQLVGSGNCLGFASLSMLGLPILIAPCIDILNGAATSRDCCTTSAFCGDSSRRRCLLYSRSHQHK